MKNHNNENDKVSRAAAMKINYCSNPLSVEVILSYPALYLYYSQLNICVLDNWS